LFGPAPKGFWPDGGWFTKSKGETKGIRAMEGRWTRELTESELGNESDVTEVVLPCGVTAIAGDAFRGYAMLHSLTIQPGCVTTEDGTGWNEESQRHEGAMAGCSSLVKATISWSCATIGAFAFCDCSGLTELVIPSSVTAIGYEAFYGCSGLTELVTPWGVTTIAFEAFSGCSGLRRLTISASLTAIGWRGRDAFRGVTLDRVTLVGSPLEKAVIAALDPALAPGAKVISAALAGQAFGRFTIVAA
jgi:hypothetical protein